MKYTIILLFTANAFLGQAQTFGDHYREFMSDTERFRAYTQFTDELYALNKALPDDTLIMPMIKFLETQTVRIKVTWDCQFIPFIDTAESKSASPKVGILPVIKNPTCYQEKPLRNSHGAHFISRCNDQNAIIILYNIDAIVQLENSPYTAGRTLRHELDHAIHRQHRGYGPIIDKENYAEEVRVHERDFAILRKLQPLSQTIIDSSLTRIMSTATASNIHPVDIFMSATGDEIFNAALQEMFTVFNCSTNDEKSDISFTTQIWIAFNLIDKTINTEKERMKIKIAVYEYSTPAPEEMVSEE